MTHEAIIFAALWVSEAWHALWENRQMLRPGARPLYYKARAIVVYDRCIAMAQQRQAIAGYDPLEETGDGGPHEARLLKQRKVE